MRCMRRRTKGAVQKVATTALIAICLGAVPAAAAERPGRATVTPVGPLAQARALVGGLLAAWGLRPMTSVGGWSSTTRDEGHIIDPDGFRVHLRDQTVRPGIQAVDNSESEASWSGR